MASASEVLARQLGRRVEFDGGDVAQKGGFTTAVGQKRQRAQVVDAIEARRHLDGDLLVFDPDGPDGHVAHKSHDAPARQPHVDLAFLQRLPVESDVQMDVLEGRIDGQHVGDAPHPLGDGRGGPALVGVGGVEVADIDDHQGRHARAVLADPDGLHVVGQPVAHRADATAGLFHHRREVVLRFDLEDDLRPGVLGLGGHLIDLPHAAERLLEPEGHHPLHIDGRGPGKLGLDFDLGGLLVGHQRPGRAVDLDRPEDADGQGDQIHQQRPIDEESNQRLHRHTSGSSGATAIRSARARQSSP